jgi:general secretion pathway protein D
MLRRALVVIRPVSLSVSLGLTLSLALVSSAVWAGPDSTLEELEFRDATVQDAIRTLAELTDTNIIATQEAGERRFTLYLRRLTVTEAIDSIARVAGLWHRRNEQTGVFMMMTTDEYFRDLVVLREEVTEVFTLRYQNMVRIGRIIEAMFGSDRVLLDLQENLEDDLDLPGGSLSAVGGTRRTGGRREFRGRRSTASPRGTGGRGRSGQDFEGVTPEQLNVVEDMQAQDGGTSRIVPEEVVARLREDNQVPIFVSVNRAQNQLFVRTADRQAMAQIREIVAESDRPTPQVLLEMKVLTVELDEGFQSAFDFSYASDDTGTGPPDGQPPNPLQSGAGSGPEQLLGVVNPGLVDGSNLVFQVMSDNIRARLQVLEREGRLNRLATPMLLASNNRPARIFIGEQTVITTGFTTGGTQGGQAIGGTDTTVIETPVPQTEVVEVGNTLTILPSINADRTVVMRLIQETSQVQVNGARIPVVTGGTVTDATIDTIDTSTIEGTAMAKDGLAVVIGGMITQAESDTVRKVPLLGDIPLLGALFRDIQRQDDQMELVLLITPHVFTTPEEAEAVSRQRLGALTQSPDNQLKLYLDELDAERAQSAAGRSVNEAVAAASPTPRSARGRRLVTLVRSAAEAMAAGGEGATRNPALAPVPLPEPGPFVLSDDGALETRAERSWRGDGRYVTAVAVRNRADTAQVVDERRFRGEWLAAAVVDPRLAPGASTRVYLVSRRPFAEARVSASGAQTSGRETRDPASRRADGTPRETTRTEEPADE